MQNELIEQNISNKILQDTWEIREDIATWYINLSSNFSTLSREEINIWYEKSVVETLNSFSKILRPWYISFRSSPDEKVENIEIEWKPGISYEQYYKTFSKAIKEFPFRISILEMQVDFYVYTNTVESPNKATKNWIRYLGKFSFCGSNIHSHPFIYLNVNNTLFCPSSIYEVDNSELYYLNQSLLEEALRNWEQAFGTINEFDGLEGVYKYGFLPEN